MKNNSNKLLSRNQDFLVNDFDNIFSIRHEFSHRVGLIGYPTKQPRHDFTDA